MSDLRQTVLEAGTGWCAFTHQHDNSQAALNAARAALEHVKQQIIENETTPEIAIIEQALKDLGG